jgi:hypothetical protein
VAADESRAAAASAAGARDEAVGAQHAAEKTAAEAEDARAAAQAAEEAAPALMRIAQQEKQAADAEAASARESAAEAQAQAAAATEALEAARAEVARKDDELADLRAAQDAAVDAADAAEAEQQRLRERVAELEAAAICAEAEHAAAVRAAEAATAQAQEQGDAARAELANLRASSGLAVEQLEERVARLQARADEEAAARDAEERSGREARERLAAEHASEVHAVMQKHKDELSAIRSSHLAENTRLRRELAETGLQLDEARGNHEQAQDFLTRATNKRLDVEERLKRTSQELVDLRTQWEQQVLTQLERERDVEAQLAAARLSKASKKEKEKAADAAEVEEQYKEKLAAKEKMLEKSNVKYIELRTSFDDALVQLHRARQDLEKARSDVTALLSQDTSAVYKENETLRARVAEMRELHDKLIRGEYGRRRMTIAGGSGAVASTPSTKQNHLNPFF